MPQVTDRFVLHGEHDGHDVTVTYQNHWRRPAAPGQVDNELLESDTFEVVYGDIDLSAGKFEFDTVDTGIGTMITRPLLAVPDSHVVTFGVLLPHVATGATTDRGAVHALGVLSRVETPFAPPAAQGAIETYEHVALSGVLERSSVGAPTL